MRSTILKRTSRWLGASALALLVGIGGVSTAFVMTGQTATAQVQNAAQIVVPEAVQPQAGFADLVEAVKPAVVSILVEAEESPRAMQRGGGREFNFDFPDLPEGHPFRDFFDQFGDQFGQQGPRGGQEPSPRQFMAAGSGFVISADGYIVTNNHVVENATKVTVVFDDGTEQEAEIVGTDERTDLAVVKIEGTDLPFVNFETESSRVGDWVVAVGNPFGLGGTVTVGVISGSGRNIGGSNYGDFLQIDAAVNTGNSGGPAFNTKGEVVGVNTAIYSPNGGNVGIAFAIPAATVKGIVQQLIEDGSVTRGYLGVGIQDVNRDIADGAGLAEAKGAIVSNVAEDGPAGPAGVKSGDIITAVDGDPIDDALDLSRTIAGKSPDSTVELTVWRDGAETTLSVQLGTLNEEAAAQADPAQPPVPEAPLPEESSVGLTLVPNADGSGGLLIQNVDPESAAAEKGLAVGDAILEVNNTPVNTVEEFEAALDAVKAQGRNTALVKASRDGNDTFIGLPLSE
ncbi:MAG: Do family serine endopeptidase [Devosia sp.]|jgi:serine protease Do|nr:Do family serine endopeptidase [Alphaproteobacteria bacterium]MBU1563335.1 Do family serine endopeptidase [Alphaproteobacteria bacterium]MBU2302058.1 Do family serine endopeptidase [Alphaproteobacteria bacterium]MBU2367314.1 Do family serine endopeptidase [Alphaproteobacteria bacterium]